MRSGYIILMLLIISTFAAVPNAQISSMQSLGITTGSVKEKTPKVALVQGEIGDGLIRGGNVSLGDVYSSILGYLAEYGGFKPSENSVDSYANSTMWGILAIYLMGKIDKFKSDIKNLDDFLSYLYDEHTGGFRDWLEGSPNIEATAFSLIIANLTGIYPEEFNKTITLDFIKNQAVQDEGFREYGNAEVDLYTTSLAAIALKLLNANISQFSYIPNVIKSYYQNGKFLDNNSRANELIQTFFALKALRILGENISYLSASTTQYIFTLERSVNSSIKGFGLGEEPTLFETGLALEILLELGYNISSTNQYRLFIEKCYLEGSFSKTINSAVEDIYQIAGAILSLYAIGDLYEGIDVDMGFDIGSNQIPIDMNTTEMYVKLKLDGETLNYFNVSTNLSGNLIYDSQMKRYRGLANFTGLNFGNHTIQIDYFIGNMLISRLEGHALSSFRRGYNLTLSLSETQVPPGESIDVNATVSFHNGTLVHEGSIAYKLYDGNMTVVSGNVTNVGFTSFTIEIPNDTLLGQYTLIVFVNDSHGVDHTVQFEQITVYDSVVLDLLEGNKTVYHLGELISTNVSLKYGTSGNYIPVTSITPYYVLGAKETNGTATWINSSYVKLEVNVSNVMPTKLNGTFYLRIDWLNDLKTTLMLFNFTIALDDLTYSVSKQNEYQIGDSFNMSLKLYSNTSQMEIPNATVRMLVTSGNKTYMDINLEYNESAKRYLANATVNPNMPEGYYNLTVKVLVPANNTFIEVQAEKLEQVYVTGFPEIMNFTKSKETVKIGEVIEFKFYVINNITKKNLTGLELLANVTSKKENFTKPIGEKEGIYIFSLKPNYASKYGITIYRSSDKLILYSFEIKVRQETPNIYDLLEPYILGGLWTASIALIGIYLVARYLIGKRISKRYLVRKRKTKKK
ncbi:MAG: prenyltransferase/squalene oxidase repeat-containing protein [Candidatus Njordarchaeia archaeon]